MQKNKMKFKKGDLVLVTTGKDRGKQGHITKALPKDMKIIVEGINMMGKRIKPTMDNPKSSVLQVEHPIHSSNVSLVDPRTGLPTKVGLKFDTEGNKVRFSKRTGETV